MENFNRKSLKAKLILTFLLVSIIPVAIIGYLSFNRSKKALVETRITSLESIAGIKVQKIEAFFEERKDNILVAQDYFNVKTNLPIVSKYANNRSNPAYINAKKMLDSQLLTFQKVYGYDDLMLVNRDGIIVYNTNENHSIYDLGNTLHDPGNKSFSNGKKGLYFSDIYENKMTKNVYELLITAPIYDATGTFAGVIALELNMQNIFDFIQDNKGLGDTGETLLGKKSGKYAAFLNPLRHDKNATLKHKIILGSNKAIPIQEAVQGNEGTGISIDYRNKKIIAVWRYIPLLDWGLVAKIDTSDAFKPINLLGLWVIWVTLPIALIVTFVAYIFAKKISAPITRLMRSTELIANGDLTQRIDIDSENEIGLLADSFNKMTNELEAAKRDADKKDWLKTGQAKLNDIMHECRETTELANKIINYIANYLNAQIGTLYIVKDKSILILEGSYAYKVMENSSNELQFGEGIVGQVAIGKQNMVIDNIPEDYLTINSSLGKTSPSFILISPFLYKNRTKGVIELGFIGEPKKINTEFINIVSENIAIAINSAQISKRTQELHEQTQQQSEELQSQQEELRETNEMLQTQQEELRVANEELEERSKTLEKGQAEIQQKNDKLNKTQKIIGDKAKELELASKYKSEFLANMSHELRTPLNSLLILSKYLEDNKEGNLTKKQVECAHTVYTAGNDLLTLINDILDLSKIEAGKAELNIDQLDIKDFTFNIEQFFEPVANEKDINFTINIDDKIPEIIITDNQKLAQVVKNLLANSFKFTESGEVKFSIYKPDNNIHLNNKYLESNNIIAISISDTGIGISTEKQQSIFAAFQQADGATTRKFGGTGLGLSISKELARLLNGEIQLKSEVGKGSTFTLFIPEVLTKDIKPTTAEITTEASVKPQSKELPIPKTKPVEEIPNISDDREDIENRDKTILIVEDDTKFAKILLDLARKKEFKAMVAKDGETGIELAIKYIPSAIILDLSLPGIDGFEVMRNLKEDPKTCQIPIHFISATDNHIEAIKNGAIGYLTKPVNIEKLNEAFKKIEDIISSSLKKLLLIEDDVSLNKFILKFMKKHDIAISSTSSGKEALNLLQTESFDCIILDIGLPDMSGFELLEKIKRDKKLVTIPIIIYTGKDISKKEDEILQKYADKIVLKGAKSPERLLDETTLFLHRIEADLPESQRKLLKTIHDKDHIFKNKKVLLVDDDVRNVFALSSILEDRGMMVIPAKNGKEGLELLDKHYDTNLVLMDIMMPEMNGYEAINKIRDNKKFQKIPILALTAKAMLGDREKCIKAGANDYLAKPVDTNKLLTLLRVWLYK